MPLGMLSIGGGNVQPVHLQLSDKKRSEYAWNLGGA